MRGVIAAGGTGSRMGPLTSAVNKHLLPLHDKPMIYYALSTLMAAGVRDIVLVTAEDQIRQFEQALGDGSILGIHISYEAQTAARGVADVLHVAHRHLGDETFAFILGDNFFHGPGLGRRLGEVQPEQGGHVFAARVSNPRDYGVVTLASDGTPTDIQEKPANPASNFVIPGLYFYTSDIWPILSELEPSARGELEISDLNRALLSRGHLRVEVLPRGTVWLDAGTISALEKASEFVSVLQARQGLLIGCPEEVAFVHGWLSTKAVRARGNALGSSEYGQYLRALAGD